MKATALMVCKGFIERCPPEAKQGLSSLLSPESQAILERLPSPSPLEPAHLKWDLLDHIHCSWLSPYLRTLSEGEIRLFLGALSQEQTNGLQKILGFENHLPEIPAIGKKGLREILKKQVLHDKELVPFAFLPDHPLNTLLNKSASALSKLILFLGLHDLSTEVRQIISTAELKKIFSSLSKKESDYLNNLMLHKEPIVFKRLFLQNWDGSKEHLHKILEERGLHRLGHALWNTSDSFTWYLTHKLDMHLGNLLLKYREKPTHERSEKILANQVEKILQIILKEAS